MQSYFYKKHTDYFKILAAAVVDFLATKFGPSFETLLHRAIDKEEFVVHYQPQILLESGEITKTEALVRWQGKQRGLTLPGNFIPLAETSGLIDDLGEWVLREACRQNKIWNDAGYKSLSVAVNVSSIQFHRGEFIRKVEKIIEETGIDPKNLEFEITERTLFENADLILDDMKQMEKWGIKFSLDDFSMGYSSLTYVQKFPISGLKIDRSFVMGVPGHPVSCTIAKSIITLAHNLNMVVVAEAVENLEQLQFLYDQGCDNVQGYIFDAALPGNSISEILTPGRYDNIISKIKRTPQLL